MSIILADAEFSGCASDAALLAATTLGNCRKLRRFVGLVRDLAFFRSPLPEFNQFDSLFGAFQLREFGPM